MSEIILQGKLEENKKTVSVLKSCFPKVKVKASMPSVAGNTTVLEVSSEPAHKDEYSPEDIDKAMLCCSSIIKRCSECPYIMEDGCKNRLALDGAVMVSRLFSKL